MLHLGMRAIGLEVSSIHLEVVRDDLEVVRDNLEVVWDDLEVVRTNLEVVRNASIFKEVQNTIQVHEILANPFQACDICNF